jgi:hypothetical protein
MTMKKITTVCAFFALLYSGQIYAQQAEKSPQDQKKDQISFYQDLIKRSNDPKEIAKAEVLLAELKAKKALSNAEEQKKMSETATPAEYNAWKSKTQQNFIVKPEENK